MQGQHLMQIGELVLALSLGSVIGLEREIHGKSAGIRTQAIVATSAALLVLVSKYGFDNTLQPGTVVLDPSRVAAQIVSGVGFLGAGLILTHKGAVRGLTTAAAVWETAAIGMASGAGLWLLALAVTGLHGLTVYGYTAWIRWLRGGFTRGAVLITYADGRGILRNILEELTNTGYSVLRLVAHDVDNDHRASVTIHLSGKIEYNRLTTLIGGIDGVYEIDRSAEGDE